MLAIEGVHVPGNGSPASSSRVNGGRAESREAGYVLLGVIFMVALVVLSLAIAAPRIASAIQRDRELELVHRGEQYKRAIRLYYKKFGSYPSSIDQLEKTNNIRFLRKRYLDPLTGKDDWKLIRMGQAHVRPLGFFGQSIGVGTPIAGASPIGGGSLGSSPGSGSSLSGNGSSAFGGNTSGGSGFGSVMGSSTSAGGVMGATGAAGGTTGGGLYAPSSGDDGTGSSAGTGSGNSSSSAFGSNSGGSNSGGSNSGGTTIGTGSSATSTSTTLGGGNTNSTGFGASTSTTLGGAPLVGVMPPMTKATILQYKLKTNYKDWEFVYDPVEEQTAAGSILGGAGNINGTGNSVNGPGSSSGTSNTPGTGTSSPSFGGMGGLGAGSNPSQPTNTPQQ